MSVQSTIYDLETTDIRFFLSTKPIASKSHVAIWIKGDDDIYRITNESEYELINDSIVFPTHPSGKALEVRVGDTPSDLVQAPNDIAIVSSIAGEVVIVADSVQDVITVSDNISSVTIVSDNMTELLVISADIDLVLLSKEYAVNPEDTAITDNPTDYSSLHYSKKAEEFALEAQNITDSINFPAGLIMEWHTDRKPTGWLWCDGESYSVFSPTPSLAYDELYQVLVDNTYVMTTKPTDWDTNYPDDPNGWYDPNFVGSVVTQAELDLLVTVPDRRGLFVRGKDRAGSVGDIRGLDTHGVVDFDTVIPSQNKAHTHDVYAGTITGNGSTDDDGSASPDNMDDLTTTSEGGAEANPTYGTTNYIIRAKGSYNGDGTGSGGTGAVPIASEVEVVDTYGNGVANLQESTDDIYDKQFILSKDVGSEPPTVDVINPDVVSEPSTVIAFSAIYSLHNENAQGLIRTTLATGEESVLRAGDFDDCPMVIDRANGKLYLVRQDSPYELFRWDIDENCQISNEVASNAGSVGRSLAYHPTNNDYVFTSSTSADVMYLTRLSDGVTVTTQHVGGSNPRFFNSETGTVFMVDSAGGLYTVDLTDFAGVTVVPTGRAFTDTFYGTRSLSYWLHAPQDSDGSFVTNFTDSKDFRKFTIDEDDTYAITVLDPLPIPDDMSLGYSMDSQDYRFGIRLLLYRDTVITVYPLIRYNVDPNKRIYAGFSKHRTTSVGLGWNSLNLHSGLNGGADGVNSMTLGTDTKTDSSSPDSLALGRYNDPKTGTLLEIGNGTEDLVRSNVVEVYDDGDIQIPNRLAVPNAKSALTKDIGDGLYHPKETGFTGSFLIANGDTVTVVNGIITTVAP